MKKILDRVTKVTFWAIPLGTIAAIWYLPLWKIPATAMIALVFLFCSRVLTDTFRQIEELKKSALLPPGSERNVNHTVRKE